MKKLYMIFAGGVFLLFCTLERRGVAFDTNETAPKPSFTTSRGGSGGSGHYRSSSYFFSK